MCENFRNTIYCICHGLEDALHDCKLLSKSEKYF